VHGVNGPESSLHSNVPPGRVILKPNFHGADGLSPDGPSVITVSGTAAIRKLALTISLSFLALSLATP
jgi:hypothetical protein